MRTLMEDRSSPSRRRGFTLVEILTVIVIIGILVGLVTTAVGPVKNVVKNWRMKSEILQLSLAMEQVKTQLGGGEYPPDGGDITVNASFHPAAFADTIRFLRRAFPRASYTYATATLGSRTVLSVTYPGGLTANLGLLPETAICFWLGGMRDASGNFIGFSADPTDPFNLKRNHGYSPATPESRIGPFFDFDKARLGQVDPSTSPEGLNYNRGLLTNTDGSGTACTYYLGFTAYFPQNDQAIVIPVAGNTNIPNPSELSYSPYLYFKAVGGMYSDQTAARAATPLNSTEAYHYWQQAVDGVYVVPMKDARSASSLANATGCLTRAWINPSSFQILCPGLDGLFAAATSGSYAANSSPGDSQDVSQRYAPIYPDGLNYAGGTKDDVTNFSNGKLENDMP